MNNLSLLLILHVKSTCIYLTTHTKAEKEKRTTHYNRSIHETLYILLFAVFAANNNRHMEEYVKFDNSLELPVNNPDKACSNLEEHNFEVERINHNKQADSKNSSSSSSKIKILMISDTHGQHRKLNNLPKSDILIHCGDISVNGCPESFEDFADWFENLQQFTYKIVIAGNHDLTLCEEPKNWYHENYKQWSPQLVPEEAFDQDRAIEAIKNRGRWWKNQEPEFLKITPSSCKSKFIYLENESVTIENLLIHGSPATRFPINKSGQFSAFSTDRSYKSCLNDLSKIPKNCDILITHGPACGAGDLVKYDNVELRVGCVNLRKKIVEDLPNLKLHCFGHIHEDHGIFVEKQTARKKRLYHVNAAICGRKNQICYEPITLEI